MGKAFSWSNCFGFHKNAEDIWGGWVGVVLLFVCFLFFPPLFSSSSPWSSFSGVCLMRSRLLLERKGEKTTTTKRIVEISQSVSLLMVYQGTFLYRGSLKQDCAVSYSCKIIFL